MKEEVYKELLEQVKTKEGLEIDMSYDEYTSYIEILKEKINYTDNVYNHSEENQVLFTLTEIATLVWGLFGLATVDFFEQKDDSYIGVIFHSMTTQISNNLLSILILCNNSLDMQSGIMIRSTCELCYTLLVVLVNDDKRKKYVEAGQTGNELKIWNEEFKFNQLNEELKNFEASLTKNNKYVKKQLTFHRKNIYRHYSEYTHSSFLSCWINSYEYNDSNPSYYNIWGEKSSRVKKYLTSINELNLFTFLDLFNFIVKNIEIKKYVGKDDLKQKLWNHAGYMFFIFREYYVKNISLIN